MKKAIFRCSLLVITLVVLTQSISAAPSWIETFTVPAKGGRVTSTGYATKSTNSQYGYFESWDVGALLSLKGLFTDKTGSSHYYGSEFYVKTTRVTMYPAAIGNYLYVTLRTNGWDPNSELMRARWDGDY